MYMRSRSSQRQLNLLLKPTLQPVLNVAFVRPDSLLMRAANYVVPHGEDWARSSRRWIKNVAAALTSLTFLSATGVAYTAYTLGHHPLTLQQLPQWTQPWVAQHLHVWPRNVWPSPVIVPTIVHVPLVTVTSANAHQPLPDDAITPAMARDRAVEAAKRLEAARQAQLLNRQEALADVISAQYFIAHEAALLVVQQAFQAAAAHQVDPLLLLAVTGVESRFNPFAGSNAGALGLTQPLPGAHPDKMQPLHQRGGSILNVRDNLDLGAQILREYLSEFNNNATLALQQYNGSLHDGSRAYSTRVFHALAPLKMAADKADRSFKGV